MSTYYAAQVGIAVSIVDATTSSKLVKEKTF